MDEAAKNERKKRILMRYTYIGTDYYPAIISRETFAKANGRRLHRANLHGSEEWYTAPPIHKAFELTAAETHFDDPAEQAEYISRRKPSQKGCGNCSRN